MSDKKLIDIFSSASSATHNPSIPLPSFNKVACVEGVTEAIAGQEKLEAPPIKTEFITTQIKVAIQSRWPRAENITINAEQGTATFTFDGCVARWSTDSPTTVSIAGSDHGAWLRWTGAELIKLSPKDSVTFAKAMENPPEPSDRLKDAAQRYKAKYQPKTDEFTVKTITLEPND